MYTRSRMWTTQDLGSLYMSHEEVSSVTLVACTSHGSGKTEIQPTAPHSELSGHPSHTPSSSTPGSVSHIARLTRQVTFWQSRE
jgi:hypothetical protein